MVPQECSQQNLACKECYRIDDLFQHFPIEILCSLHRELETYRWQNFKNEEEIGNINYNILS
jgi:hypothetical protein